MVGGLDEVDGQAEVAEDPVALGDDQGEVVWIDEPFETKPAEKDVSESFEKNTTAVSRRSRIEPTTRSPT